MTRTVRVLPAASAVAVSMLALSAPAARADLDEVRDLLLGRTAVCKIDMPVLKGVDLTPDGRLVEKTYKKRLKKHRPSFTAGERAEITKVTIDKTELRICLNGCGAGFIGPGSRIAGKLDRIGSSVRIQFSSPPGPSDLQPSTVLAALSGVVTVEGVESAGAAVPRRQPWPAGPAAVELLAVEVDPPEVSPGQTVRLVIDFEVAGAGLGLPISEERQIFKDEVPLLSTPRSATETWVDGSHRTLVEFPVPADAAAGAYVFEGTVRGAGNELSRRAVFLVR